MHYSLNQALSIELEWRIQRKMAYIIYSSNKISDRFNHKIMFKIGISLTKIKISGNSYLISRYLLRLNMFL